MWPGFLGAGSQCILQGFWPGPTEEAGVTDFAEHTGGLGHHSDQNLGCLLTDWKLLLCCLFLYGPQLSHLYDGDIIITELKVYPFHFLSGSVRRVLLLWGWGGSGICLRSQNLRNPRVERGFEPSGFEPGWSWLHSPKLLTLYHYFIDLRPFSHLPLLGFWNPVGKAWD